MKASGQSLLILTSVWGHRGPVRISPSPFHTATAGTLNEETTNRELGAAC